jgi:hypothetical protein
MDLLHNLSQYPAVAMFNVMKPATSEHCTEMPAPLATGLHAACQVNTLITARQPAGWAITDLPLATLYTNFSVKEANCHLNNTDTS